jgi:hypothetical protein
MDKEDIKIAIYNTVFVYGICLGLYWIFVG